MKVAFSILLGVFLWQTISTVDSSYVGISYYDRSKLN